MGNAINGTTGAIIGAAASVQKSAKEVAILESQRISAEAEYQRVLNESSKL